MHKKSLKILILLLPFISIHSLEIMAQGVANRPYPVYDTKPVIIQEPYLVDPSETGITVVWLTDTPSHSKVIYGKKGEGSLSLTSEVQEHGMVPVGTLHTIRIEDLEPGTTYEYKVMSRRVVQINPYWPEMGGWVESPVYSFTTFDPEKESVSFSAITDTHEEVDRIQTFMNMIDWDQSEFLVHLGDSFDWINDEKHLYDKWLSPIAEGLHQTKPMIYARGNHELRGAFARNEFEYVPIHEGNFYYARNHGPLHLMVLDSGEDKHDTTNVYAGLNRLDEYREQQFEWFSHHVEYDETINEADFRIIAIHDPRWGWVNGENDKWTQMANKANVHLMIAGHRHRYMRIAPGEQDGNDYHILVLSPQQIAHIDVNENFIEVEVRNTDDELVTKFQINKEKELIEID